MQEQTEPTPIERTSGSGDQDSTTERTVEFLKRLDIQHKVLKKLIEPRERGSGSDPDNPDIPEN